MRNINPTTIRLTEEDKALIETLKQRYGQTSTMSVIRLALRLLAERGNERGKPDETPPR